MTIHRKRESFQGFDLGTLRRNIQAKQGLGTNEQMFSGRGDCWTATRSEERQEAVRRQRLEHHLREASFDEQQFIGYLRDKLADAGPVSRPTWDKTKLSKQRLTDCSATVPSRKVHETKAKAIRKRVNKLADFEKELTRKQRNQQVKCSKTYKEYGHFVMEKG